MSALVFLFLAVVISGVGSLVLVLRNRRPTSVESGIDEFRREMNALAPPSRSSRSGRPDHDDDDDKSSDRPDRDDRRRDPQSERSSAADPEPHSSEEPG